MPIFDKIGDFAKNTASKTGQLAKKVANKTGDLAVTAVNATGDFAKKVADKTDVKLEISRINGQIKDEQGVIEKKKQMLGERYFTLRQSGSAVEADAELNTLYQEILDSQKKIDELENEVRSMREKHAPADDAEKEDIPVEEEVSAAEEATEAAQDEEDAPKKYFCPVCGVEVPEGSLFCPVCGASLK